MSTKNYLTHKVTDTPPTFSDVGDEYFNPKTNTLYKKVVYNGTNVAYSQIISTGTDGNVPITGNITLSSISSGITFGDGTTQTTAGSGGSGTDAFARTQANSALIVGQSAYTQANTATIIAQAAYAQANTGGGGGTSNSFSTILVSGQSNVIANTPTGRLTFVAGSGMTITTAQTSNTITFASTGGFSGGTITNQLIIANSTPSISNGTGALIVQGGVGVTGNIYIGANSVMGFANSASNSVVYQVYNATTNSLDTIFG
jgi:hypothetical protein